MIGKGVTDLVASTTGEVYASCLRKSSGKDRLPAQICAEFLKDRGLAPAGSNGDYHMCELCETNEADLEVTVDGEALLVCLGCLEEDDG